MLEIDREAKSLHPMRNLTPEDAALTERGDLQTMIRGSPNAFFSEMGETLLLLGEEVRPADFVADRIDLLAIDQDGAAVVIELKRSHQKLHLLQALSYAAMVAKWDGSRLIEERARLTGKPPEDTEDEVEGFLLEDAATLNDNQRVILVAGAYDYEVLVTAEWLTEKFGVDIRCYRLAISADDNSEYLSCTCIFPPPELTAHAVKRGRTGRPKPGRYADWDEALAAVSNGAMVEYYERELKAGREQYLPRRTLRYRIDGRRRYWVSARKSYAYVWQQGRFEGDEEYWRETLSDGDSVELVKDARCLRFLLKTAEDFEAFHGSASKDLLKKTWTAPAEEQEEP